MDYKELPLSDDECKRMPVNQIPEGYLWAIFDKLEDEKEYLVSMADVELRHGNKASADGYIIRCANLIKRCDEIAARAKKIAQRRSAREDYQR